MNSAWRRVQDMIAAFEKAYARAAPLREEAVQRMQPLQQTMSGNAGREYWG